VRKAIQLTEAQAAGLVGRYQFAPGIELAITREGASLFGQVTGQGRAEIFAESPTKFFWKIVDAQLTFALGADGAATGLVLHQNGRDVPAGRIRQ
jgi:serine-type D-Ala-D-Ala carboxypeptidase/endopeptidase